MTRLPKRERRTSPSGSQSAVRSAAAPNQNVLQRGYLRWLKLRFADSVRRTAHLHLNTLREHAACNSTNWTADRSIRESDGTWKRACIA